MANIANNAPARPWYDGERINSGLAGFNHWKDDFFVELAPIMLMLGFITGTIDVLTSGSIEHIPAISVAWAIVQAISIDGLFFAVWGKIRRFDWTRKTWFQGLMLIAVGLMLSIVAALVNNILSYEELNHVNGIGQVMTTLGIDAAAFSYGRSILVVIVALLVALFTKGRGLSVRELQETIARLQNDIDGLRSTRDSLAQEKSSLQAQYTTLEAQSKLDREAIARLAEERSTLAQETQDLQETIARLRRRGQSMRSIDPTSAGALAAPAQERETGFIARDNGETLTVSNGTEMVYATGSHRDRIYAAMLAMYQNGQEPHYPTIAQSIGVGLSTVKKYGPEIKEEIAKQSTQSMKAVHVEQVS